MNNLIINDGEEVNNNPYDQISNNNINNSKVFSKIGNELKHKRMGKNNVSMDNEEEIKIQELIQIQADY